MINPQKEETIKTGMIRAHPSLAEHPAKVEAKIQSLKRGLWYFVIGGILLLLSIMSFAFMAIMMRGQELGWAHAVMVLALPGLFGLGGIYFIFAGGNLASAEAMRAAGDNLKGLGGLAARIVSKAHKS